MIPLRINWRRLPLGILFVLGRVCWAQPGSDTCQWTGGSCEWDYDMHEMRVIFPGGRNESFFAFMDPDVSSYYNEEPGWGTVVEPSSAGMYGKFVNMSPDPIQIFYSDNFVCEAEPFGSCGTATFPGHVFEVKPIDKKKVLQQFQMQGDTLVYIYDPYKTVSKAIRALSPSQQQLYMMQHNNNLFAKQYKKATGRDWLALYQHKTPPMFHMWHADYFGQRHDVETSEIYFVEIPPAEHLDRGVSAYGPRPMEITDVRKYRDTYPTMNLTLKAISCSPRVFEIQNFLNDVEISHLMALAEENAYATQRGLADDEDEERSSRLIGRESTIITDAIFRRAADVLQIDEKFLRWRRKDEVPEFSDSMVSIAEPLQMVHYNVGQHYTPQFDFTMPGLIQGQPSRFATIMLYLNGNMEGGETSFPRWRNAETSEALEVKPEKGKAVLFYNLLPDGNYDERSLHAELPVTSGKKSVANLWVWDPFMLPMVSPDIV